jgi:hypothetical protein
MAVLAEDAILFRPQPTMEKSGRKKVRNLKDYLYGNLHGQKPHWLVI